MKTFSYKAVNAQGHILKAVGTGLLEQEIHHLIQQQGYTLLKIKEISCYRQIFKSSIKDQHLEEFCYHVVILDQAGVPLLDILTSYRDWHKTLRSPLTNVIEGLKQGQSLAHAFAREPKVFSILFCAMVDAAAQMGCWSPGFDQLARFFKWRHEFKAHLWKSLRYPLLLLSMMGGLMVLLVTWVLPQLGQFLTVLNQDLPLATRALLYCTHHSSNIFLGIVLILTSLLTLFFGIKRLSSPLAFLLDQGLLKTPIGGKLLHQILLQHFLYIFIALLNRGLPLLEALKTASDNTKNIFLQKKFSDVKQKILQGLPFSQAWQSTSGLDPRIGRLAETGEFSGQLGPSLQHGLTFLRRDIEVSTQRLVTLFQPLLLLILGGMMLWLMLAILLPLYDQMMRLEE